MLLPKKLSGQNLSLLVSIMIGRCRYIIFPISQSIGFLLFSSQNFLKFGKIKSFFIAQIIFGVNQIFDHHFFFPLKIFSNLKTQDGLYCSNNLLHQSNLRSSLSFLFSKYLESGKMEQISNYSNDLFDLSNSLTISS